MKWLPYPMLRIAAFFVSGVLLAIYFPEFIPFNFVVAIISFLSIAFFIVRFISKKNLFSILSGLIGLSVIFFLGYARLLLFTDSRNENHLSKITEPIDAYEAIVRSVPEEKAKSWKVELEVVAVKIGNWKQVTGNLLLYISKNGVPKIDWHYGDKILVKGNPQELKSPMNPGEFDFKRFLSFKNISHQQFVQFEDVKFVEPVSRKGFVYYSHAARAWSMQKLNQFLLGEDERAIAIALVLGVTDGIDNDILNAYAASGAMHVLAVSGMHIGIIYAIILFLFKPIEKLKYSKWITAVVSLIFLWAFSFITGNSPSVLRAVTMFSFIAVARPFQVRTNIYNTLAASVFVLLIYNPYLVMSVGFQLSYLAVLGIVYLQKPIYDLIEIENKYIDWVWQITCVSIAAQAATFALGLLYFHQFPTYFLISNLFVIPLSTIVLVVGIFLLLISFISPLANVVGIVLEYLIKALNWIVFTTEDLPMSLINNIYIDTFQCLLLIGILLSMILLFELKSVKWLYVSFVLTIAFSFLQWNHFFESINQKQLIVYSINKHQAIEFIDRGRSYFVCDSSLQNDEERIRFHIQPNRLMHGVYQVEDEIPFSLEKNGINYFQWNGNKIAWLNDWENKTPLNGNFDLLIVSKNSLNKKAFSHLKANQIVFDGSNSKTFVNRALTLVEKQNIPTHSVLINGAFLSQ